MDNKRGLEEKIANNLHHILFLFWYLGGFWIIFTDTKNMVWYWFPITLFFLLWYINEHYQEKYFFEIY